MFTFLLSEHYLDEILKIQLRIRRGNKLHIIKKRYSYDKIVVLLTQNNFMTLMRLYKRSLELIKE